MATKLCHQSLNKIVHVLRHATRRFATEGTTSIPSQETAGGQGSQLFSSIVSESSSKQAHVAARWVSSHRVEVNGARIHYERGGMGNHVVLLLPGALGSARTDFGPQVDNLNKDLFTVLAWDPRGYGKSIPPERDWPENFLARDAEDAAHLMEKVMKGESEKTLELPRYSLLGWSDGGITAMMIAAKYPDRVRRLVVWGANSFLTEEECAIYEKIRDIDSWSASMRKPMVDLYGEEYFRDTWNGWVDAFTGYRRHSGGNICKDLLPLIQCPTLIIHGQKDPVVPQFHADYLHENIKHSKLINYPKGKHNVHLRFFQEFNSHVEDFLTQPDP